MALKSPRDLPCGKGALAAKGFLCWAPGGATGDMGGAAVSALMEKSSLRGETGSWGPSCSGSAFFDLSFLSCTTEAKSTSLAYFLGAPSIKQVLILLKLRKQLIRYGC